MKLCSVCNKQPATVHFTNMVNGVVESHDFCSACIQKSGLLDFASADVFKSFDAILSDALHPKVVDVKCDNCGMTLETFKKLGRFGCAKDYDLFKVEPALKKIHGESIHMGKTPEPSPVEKLKRLKKDIDIAVKAENYERAASIRDEIKKLESKT